MVESIEAPEAAEDCGATIVVNGNENGDSVGHAANGHDNGGGLDIPEFLRRV